MQTANSIPEGKEPPLPKSRSQQAEPAKGRGADGCLFCKIIRGESPSTIVYQDEYVVAFRDIAPQAPVHILVIPREHIACFTEFDEGHAALLGKIHTAINKVAEQEGMSESGFRVVVNCKDDGRQSVFHIHYHVIGKRRMGWPPG